MPKYELTITEPPIWSSFKYRTHLRADGKNIADSFADTKWGAKLWARRVARRHARAFTTSDTYEVKP